MFVEGRDGNLCALQERFENANALNKPWNDTSDFYPADALPEDCVFVVRTENLRQFERSIQISDETENGSNQSERANRPLDLRQETTFLNIIGGLLLLMMEDEPGVRSRTKFGNQTAIILDLIEKFGGKPGISERTLQQKFAAAKRSLLGS